MLKRQCMHHRHVPSAPARVAPYPACVPARNLPKLVMCDGQTYSLKHSLCDIVHLHRQVLGPGALPPIAGLLITSIVIRGVLEKAAAETAMNGVCSVRSCPRCREGALVRRGSVGSRRIGSYFRWMSCPPSHSI